MAYRPRTGDSDLDERVTSLVAAADVGGNADLITEMLGNVVRLGRSDHDRGDMKIANAAVREMRRSFAAFDPYRDRPKCSIFGSARTTPDEPAYRKAVEMGRSLAAHDWMVITGGGPGIMTAGVEGAGTDNSFGVTIRLPFESMEGGGIVPEERMVRFRYFFTRKLTFMKESSAYVVFPGGFGTMDETFELLTLIQTGKEYPAPVVLFEPDGDDYWRHWAGFVEAELIEAGLVSPPDLDLVKITSSIDDAMDFISGFYDIYHSMRYVDGRLVIRLQRPLPERRLEELTSEFSDIIAEGTIESVPTSATEIADEDAVDRPRIAMWFDNHHFARLHQLIRAL